MNSQGFPCATPTNLWELFAERGMFQGAPLLLFRERLHMCELYVPEQCFLELPLRFLCGEKRCSNTEHRMYLWTKGSHHTSPREKDFFLSSRGDRPSLRCIFYAIMLGYL